MIVLMPPLAMGMDDLRTIVEAVAGAEARRDVTLGADARRPCVAAA